MKIVLIGFMGTGKSTLGRIIAERLGYRFLDTDEFIESREERPISVIFATNGESYFRKLEEEAAGIIAGEDQMVVATGGGFVLNPDNLTRIRPGSVIISLTAEPQAIYERIRYNTDRPLLAVPDPVQRINELLQARSGCYSQADLSYDTSAGSPNVLAETILTELARLGISGKKN
jgi:shikimate kinase